MLTFGSGFEAGMRALYQAPGTSREARREVTIVRMPTLRSDRYIIDLDGEHIECGWFSLDTLPKKRRAYNQKDGLFQNHKLPGYPCK